MLSTGTDCSVKLTASIKDCACCGAKTASGGWLNFMCHNLGANEALDPFTWNSIADNRGDDIKGDLYQWGRPMDGHEKRNSGTTSTLASDNAATAPAAVVGKFITTTNASYDWRSGGGVNTSRWGDGTQNENMDRAANDPCPTGWKVPSQKQWASIYTNKLTPNTWTWTGNGYKVGDALYLPAAGYRNYSNALLDNVGSDGYYWSSTVLSALSYHLHFSSSSVNPAGSNSRGYGFSVRCVQEN